MLDFVLSLLTLGGRVVEHQGDFSYVVAAAFLGFGLILIGLGWSLRLSHLLSQLLFLVGVYLVSQGAMAAYAGPYCGMGPSQACGGRALVGFLLLNPLALVVEAIGAWRLRQRAKNRR